MATWGQHLGWPWRPGDGQRLQKRSPRGSVGEAPRDQPGGPAWTLPIRTWGGDEGLALPARPLSLWAWLLLLGFFSYSLFLFVGLFSPRWRWCAKSCHPHAGGEADRDREPQGGAVGRGCPQSPAQAGYLTHGDWASQPFAQEVFPRLIKKGKQPQKAVSSPSQSRP